MTRSAGGVTASAIIALLGSVLLLAATALTLLSLAIAGGTGTTAMPVKFLMIPIAIIEGGFACWGIACGVGLLRYREWARISMLVFSGLLLLMSIPGLAFVWMMSGMMAFQPPPANINDPESYHRIVTIMRVGMGSFYGVLIALGICWLIYFTRPKVRELFRARAAASLEVPSIMPAGGVLPQATAPAPYEPPAQTRPARPMSVTIIAWYLIITGLFFPMSFLMHVPTMVLWFLVRGASAKLVTIALCLAQIGIGIGLLKLRRWSRVAGICYCVFLIVNSFTITFAPGARARYQQAREEIMTEFQVQDSDYANMQKRLVFPLWLGLVFALPIQSAILWFLVKEKRAFDAAGH